MILPAVRLMPSANDLNAKHPCYYRSMTEIGIAVDPSPAQRPQRVVLPGRVVTLRPFDTSSQAEALYEATHGPEQEALWRYMGDGPFASFDAYQAAFEKKEKSVDPLFWAIVDNATAPSGWPGFLPADGAGSSLDRGGQYYFFPGVAAESGRNRGNVSHGAVRLR